MIESDLELPDLLTGRDCWDDVVDVSITVGHVPDALAAPTIRGRRYQATERSYLFRLPGVVAFLVEDGNRIVVQQQDNNNLDEVRAFLLATGFGMLLRQRGLLVLHAAAVRTTAGAVLFAGHSGAGKSTLLNELVARGYPMLVDDVCAVDTSAGSIPVVVPAYPRTRIWADSAEKLSIDTSALPRTRPALDKFERQLPHSFWPEPAPLRRLYVLKTSDRGEFAVKTVPRVQSFRVIDRYTYRREYLEGAADVNQHFETVTNLAANIDVRQFLRPTDSFDLARLADLVEADLAGDAGGGSNG